METVSDVRFPASEHVGDGYRLASRPRPRAAGTTVSFSSRTPSGTPPPACTSPLRPGQVRGPCSLADLGDRSLRGDRVALQGHVRPAGGGQRTTQGLSHDRVPRLRRAHVAADHRLKTSACPSSTWCVGTPAYRHRAELAGGSRAESWPPDICRSVGRKSCLHTLLTPFDEPPETNLHLLGVVDLLVEEGKGPCLKAALGGFCL